MKPISTFPRAFHSPESNTNPYDFGSRSGPTPKKYRATQRRPCLSGVSMQADSWKHFRLPRPPTPNPRSLVAFLGFKLGSGLQGGLQICMTTMEIGHCFRPDARWSGPRMSRLTGGNDPASGYRARSLALVVPALRLPQLEHNGIITGSVQHLERFSAWSRAEPKCNQ